jgi:hypothetical protein
MIKRGTICFILSILVILISGCETFKGAFQGSKKDWESVKKADEWMRKNLW